MKKEKNEHSLTRAMATVLSGKTGSEVFELLSAVLTPKELEFVEKRLRIAYLLEQKQSYTVIQKELVVSAATIASVSEQMQQAAFQTLLQAVKKEVSRFQWLKKWISR